MISLVILDKLTQQMLEGFAEFVDASKARNMDKLLANGGAGLRASTYMMLKIVR